MTVNVRGYGHALPSNQIEWVGRRFRTEELGLTMGVVTLFDRTLTEVRDLNSRETVRTSA